MRVGLALVDPAKSGSQGPICHDSLRAQGGDSAAKSRFLKVIMQNPKLKSKFWPDCRFSLNARSLSVKHKKPRCMSTKQLNNK